MEYAISSGITMSSRVIMDKVGAEKLLGNGDMLFLSPNGINPDRIQGAYVSDQEIEKNHRRGRITTHADIRRWCFRMW